MKKKIFIALAKFNRLILPSFAKKDLTKLSKFEKAVVGYRYYITKHAIGED